MLNEIIHFFSQNKYIVAILIIASLLRFLGTNPGYNQYHADEGISYSSAVEMIKHGDLDPRRYDYPALVPVINFLFFKFLFIPMNWLYYFLSHILDIIDGNVHIPIAPLEAKRLFQVFVLGERERNALFWGRYVTALFSLGNVFLVYILSKKLFNEKIAILSAFFLAFNYRHVVNSHISLPDIYNAFFVLLTFISSVFLLRNPSRKNYLFTGLFLGLSFSVKYQIFALFPFLLTHVFISLEGFKINLRKFVNPNFFVAMLASILIFIVINPYFFIHINQSLASLKDVSLKYAMGVKRLNFYPFWYFYHIDYGPFLFTASLLGIFTSLMRFKKETLVFISYLIPFMFVMIYYSKGGFYVRNFITITPIVMIFVAIFVWHIYQLLNKRIKKKFATSAILVSLPIMIFVPARNAIINSYSYTKPWGYDILRPWISSNLPKDVIVAIHPFDASNLDIESTRTTEFEIAGNYSLNEHKEAGAKYGVFDLNYAGDPFYFWMLMDFKDISRYWNKPIDIMRNTYHGIAAEELFRYQIKAVTKPWQAPDTHLIVIKFPNWPNVKMNTIKNFNFDDGLQGFKIYGKDLSSSAEFRFDREIGRGQNGSVAFIPGDSPYPTVRVTSQPVVIKPGHLYKIAGFLKTEKKLESHEREGFLRIDFYSDKDKLDKVGIISSVSSRVFGSKDWTRKEILERAPEGSKYLTLSFQVFNTLKTKIWLDDVSIEESEKEVKDITSQAPYKRDYIDLNYIYPNSHGNL